MNSIILFLLSLFFVSFRDLPRTLSDDGFFPGSCLDAAVSDEAFCSFKQNPRFNLHAEFYTYEEGAAFLEKILKEAPFLTQKFELFRNNDTIGAPCVFDYQEFGYFSPTTLYYAKFAAELTHEFGALDGYRIVEIGGGCGGLCKIISDIANFESYTLVDLPECLELAKRTLNALGVKKVYYLTPELVNEKEYDLIISDYGFSLYGSKMQKQLIQKVLANSRRGFLACNFFSKHFKIRPFNRQELLKKLKNSQLPVVLKEQEPLLGKNHCILTWNKQAK